VELFEEDCVDAACGTFDDAGPFEGIGEERIPWAWRRDEQVVEPNALGETTGIRDFHPIGMPLNVYGAEAAVVAMDQRVSDRLAEGPLWIVRHTDAEQAGHELLFTIARAESARIAIHLVAGFQIWPPIVTWATER
jgi:hypothetical protein